MAERPPWDPVKASFYLIAAVIGVYALIALMAFAACVYHSEIIIRTPEITCDPKDRLSNLLTAALAAALAFAGGYTRNPPPPGG